ncbi:MAG: hypothetical protein C0614_00850, partial [Desulfuromonas sp.]
LSSPFLGDDVVDDIVEQGGIAAWSPPQPPSGKWQHRLWSWIKQYQTDPERFPPIFLGYAEKDVITGQGPALLATALPEERVFSIPGDHDYPTFQAIWREQVERLARHLK